MFFFNWVNKNIFSSSYPDVRHQDETALKTIILQHCSVYLKI